MNEFSNPSTTHGEYDNDLVDHTVSNEKCDVCTLPDLQNREDKRGIEIKRVGVEEINFPIKVKVKSDKDGSAKSVAVSATVKLFMGLPKDYKGANMSRFMQTLLQFSGEHKVLSSSTMPDLLTTLREKLKSKDAYARFEFDYYIDVKAPVSKIVAPQRYKCAFTGIKRSGNYDFILEVNVIAASVCPCSREMSLLDNVLKDGDANGMVPLSAFEPKMVDMMKDYIKNSGMGSHFGLGAHNQRSNIKVEVIMNDDEMMWIEDLVKLIEEQASCPVYPILKRPDEKYVTEHGYNNAKFSEDITRDIQIELEKLGTVKAWNLKVSNEESIHGYNAVCHTWSESWKYHIS
jgi:GTP cyclohydrolase IB